MKTKEGFDRTLAFDFIDTQPTNPWVSVERAFDRMQQRESATWLDVEPILYDVIVERIVADDDSRVTEAYRVKIFLTLPRRPSA